MTVHDQRWDFFLAHAGADTASALELYDALTPHAAVFLDERSMVPGDPWTRVLPAVLRQSRIIVVLVSPNTQNAWYEDSEIRIALDLLRDFPERYRVIPLLLDTASPIHRSELPYGLEQTVPVSFAKCGGLPQVVDRLLDALRADTSQRDRSADGAATAVEPVALVDSTTAFIGETERGQTRPIVLTGWDEYTRWFGTAHDASGSHLALAVRGFFENGGERAYVVRVLAADSSRALVRIATEDPEQSLVVAARSVGAYGNQIAIRVQRGSRIGVRLAVERTAAANPAPRVGEHRAVAPVLLEDFDNLSLATTGPNSLMRVIDEKSEWISVEWAQPNLAPAMPSPGVWALAGGTDGHASMSDYLGASDMGPYDRTGLAALVALNDTGIVCVPGAAHPRFTSDEQETLMRAILAHCEQHTTFALLSVGSGQTAGDLPAAPVDSSSGAIYGPWITVPNVAGDTSISIPAIGHVAGAYARHDREHGVYVSPAHVELEGVLVEEPGAGAGVVQPITPQAIDAAVRRGINLVGRDPANSGRLIVASGVTMAIDEAWRRISVKRFFNYVDRVVEASTAWAEFEPDDEATRTEMRTQIEAFLTRLWRAGVLKGDTPQEAFFVRVEANTTIGADVGSRRLRPQIGVALADRDLKFPRSEGDDVSSPTLAPTRSGQSAPVDVTGAAPRGKPGL